MAFSASKSIIRPNARGYCPLQMKPRRQQPLALVDYDSDLSPLTTGPSSAASTPFEERIEEEEAATQLAYPEHDQSYFLYHLSKFPKPRVIDSDDDGARAQEEEDIVDDPLLAEQIIKGNLLNQHLFAAVCPWTFNETSVFLYGPRLTSPAFLAELLANNDQTRVYEQAARMFPARLKGFRPATIGRTDVATVVEAAGEHAEEHAVDGYVLFSTTIRERSLIQASRGKAFTSLDAHATILVSGQEVQVPVQTTKATDEWMKHAVVHL